MLNSCRLPVAQAISAPRLAPIIQPAIVSMRCKPRRKLRWLRPIQKEYFYLYACWSGEEAPDDNEFGPSLAKYIGEPNMSIERVARRLRRDVSHVEWRQNLNYWSETSLGHSLQQDPSEKTCLILRSIVCGFCVCCCLVGTWVQDLWTWSNSIAVVSWHADVGQPFCDGPFIDLLKTSNLTSAEQALQGSHRSSDQVCLAMLFDLQGSFIQAKN